MTYLELLKNLAIDYGISGAHRTLTTFSGLQGDMLLAKRQIDKAYTDIQNLWQDWTFHNASVEYFIDGGIASLKPGDDGWRNNVSAFKEGQMYARSATNRRRVTEEPWSTFNYRRGVTNIPFSRELPSRLSIAPNGELHFYLPSTEPFILNAEVRLRHHKMVAEDDVPILPDEHHEIILYRAAMHHFDAENAQDEYQRAAVNYQTALDALEAACLPMNSRSATSSDEIPLAMYSE